MFSITRVVCSLMPPSTSCPDTGSSGIDPERNTMLPALSAGEYGPIAFAAPAAVISSFTVWLCGFRDFVRTDAARADLHALGGAVHHGLDHLQVRLEAAGTHVVGVGHTAANHRSLVADFTSHCHCENSSVLGNREFYHGRTIRGFSTLPDRSDTPVMSDRAGCGRCWKTRPTSS